MVIFLDSKELLHRIDEEQERLLLIRAELFDRYSELRSSHADLKGEINVGNQRIQNVEFRVATLEDNFDMLKGRLWALLFILISEIIVACIDFFA